MGHIPGYRQATEAGRGDAVPRAILCDLNLRYHDLEHTLKLGINRIAISVLPSDLVELDALAARLAEPGLNPNRSAAVRYALRSCLASESEAEETTRAKRRRP
jgi:hypothetical protein